MTRGSNLSVFLWARRFKGWIRSASKNTTGCIASSGWFCQAMVSAMTSSVTELMTSGQASAP